MKERPNQELLPTRNAIKHPNYNNGNDNLFIYIFLVHFNTGVILPGRLVHIKILGRDWCQK